MATQLFVTNDRPNVAGLILAGSADFKTELSQSDMFDPRLQVSASMFDVLHLISCHRTVASNSVSLSNRRRCSSWLMCPMEERTASIRQSN